MQDTPVTRSNCQFSFAVKAPVVNHFRALLGIAPQTVVALYSGNMGAKQGLELLAQAAALLAEAAPRFTHAPTIQFVFCGNGAGREQLVAQCAGLTNVHFMDLQPMHLLSELLGMADIHLLPQRTGERLARTVRRGGAARAAHAVFRGPAAARPRPRHPLSNGRVRPPLRRNPSPR